MYISNDNNTNFVKKYLIFMNSPLFPNNALLNYLFYELIQY